MSSELIERVRMAIVACISENAFDDHDLYMIGQYSPDLTGLALARAATEAIREGVDSERERCAKIADDHAAATCTGMKDQTEAMRLGAQSIACAIRTAPTSLSSIQDTPE